MPSNLAPGVTASLLDAWPVPGASDLGDRTGTGGANEEYAVRETGHCLWPYSDAGCGGERAARRPLGIDPQTYGHQATGWPAALLHGDLLDPATASVRARCTGPSTTWATVRDASATSPVTPIRPTANNGS